jgi:CO/xanthine dehydrogenase FAD-binding subunit
MVAVNLLTDSRGTVHEALICVGSCSPKALRLPALEQALRGAPARKGISALVHEEHLAPLSPIDDVRGSAAYRLDAAKTLLGRALEACAEKVA